MNDDKGIKSLLESLEPTGIKVDASIIDDIIDYSPEKEDSNNKTYAEVNKMLLERIYENVEGDFLHITGEMKALKDPKHRKCIKELHSYGNQFRINFSLPENPLYPEKGYWIKRYNKEKWRHTDWIDHFDSFDILGEGKAELYNNYDRDGVQYSLFGNELVLFQSYHESTDKEKEVWIIINKKLFKSLLRRSEDRFKNSTYIRPIEFNSFNFSICNDIALDILFYLYDNDRFIEIDKFSGEFPEINTKKQYIVDNMEIMRFIEKNDNGISLLEDGQEYLKLFN